MRTDTSDVQAPEISVIVATDTYGRIQQVVECLRRQDVRDRLEIVLVTPAARMLHESADDLGEFGAVRLVEVESLVPLGAAWAVGVRAATAPVVVIGETHSYPHPGWAEALIRAHAGSWAIVVPAFGNANPDGALSWAAFLSDYGAWGDGREAGETDRWPGFNSAYRRAALLELGDGLPDALSRSDALRHGLRRRGYRAYFEPKARIDHLNVSRPIHWLHERWLVGLLIGRDRGEGWPRWRRLAYVLGGPLIPVVLVWRARHGVRWAARRWPLPAGTIPALAMGAAIRSVAEMVGYAGVVRGSPENRMSAYEVRKADYVAGAKP